MISSKDESSFAIAPNRRWRMRFGWKRRWKSDDF